MLLLRALGGYEDSGGLRRCLECVVGLPVADWASFF